MPPLIEAEELGALLEGCGAETFRLPGGKEVSVVYNAPTNDELDIRGSGPSITGTEVDLSVLQRGDLIWRASPATMFEVKGKSPMGTGTFVDVLLRRRDP